MTGLKSLGAKSFPRLASIWRALHLIRKKGSYLHTTGYLKSLETTRPVDSQGAALPFLNYPTIRVLKDRISPGLRVFEYGSGYSTLFFAGLKCQVTSVEDNEGWARLVQEMTAPYPQCKLLLRPLGKEYVESVREGGEKYDIILVDGRMRVECAAACLESLSENGVILWDDSFRERYAPGLEALKAAGFNILRLEGLKPAGFATDETSICYRQNNCLHL